MNRFSFSIVTRKYEYDDARFTFRVEFVRQEAFS